MRVILAFFFLLNSALAFSSEIGKCPQYPKLIASAPWSTDQSNLTLIVGLPESDAPSFAAELSFCVDGNRLYVDHPESSFVGIYPLGDSSKKIVTVWLTGNGTYKVKAYFYSEAGVSLVLDAISYAMPELVHPTDPGKSSDSFVLVSKTPANNEKSKIFVDVYAWTGAIYEKKTTFQWEYRFSQLP